MANREQSSIPKGKISAKSARDFRIALANAAQMTASESALASSCQESSQVRCACSQPQHLYTTRESKTPRIQNNSTRPKVGALRAKRLSQSRGLLNPSLTDRKHPKNTKRS